MRRETRAVPAQLRMLHEFAVNPEPWRNIEAYSEQRPPTYLARTPREMALGRAGRSNGSLPDFMRAYLEKSARSIRAALNVSAAEFEVWPSLNDWGPTWVFARWRVRVGDPWKWLVDPRVAARFESARDNPILPERIRLDTAAGFAQVYSDPLSMVDLYNKPAFSECVFATPPGDALYAAWLPSEQRVASGRIIRATPGWQRRMVCYFVPRPAHVDAQAATFVVRVEGNAVSQIPGITWDPTPSAPIGTPRTRPVVTSWPNDFVASFQKDLSVLSGAEDAVYLSSGARTRFRRKNAAKPNHQLNEMVTWLEERYSALGLPTQRQGVLWNGVASNNLIAVIPGSLSQDRNHPIVLADHIDTAFAEEVFSGGRQRVSVPGADDNVTAIASLLRAADVLRATRPLHDIWLLHLTGEEFPSDCSGARAWTAAMLSTRRDIGGIVLLDMIGYNPRRAPLFQVNSGKSPESQMISSLTLNVAEEVAPTLAPAYRSPYDSKNYIGNTDGSVFSDAGFPVVFLNEHINDLENINRPHYHQMSDTMEKVDLNYATSIAKIAIETAARLSQRP